MLLRPKLQPFLAVLWIGLCFVLLSGCIGGTRLQLIVPDDYAGFLLIRYDCPGGEPVRQVDGRTQIAFRSNGTACLRESYQEVFPFGTFVIERVVTVSGNASFPWITDSSHAQGRGLISIGYTERRNATGQLTGQFTDYWVGDMAKLQTLIAADRYREERADIYDQLGAHRDGSVGQPKPVASP